jgi:hypothetical protein
MFEIQQACGIPCIFIRWNPDNFRVNDVICKKYNNQKRLELLVKWIEYCIKQDIRKEQPPMYIELFYDNYDEGNIEFKYIREEDVIV